MTASHHKRNRAQEAYLETLPAVKRKCLKCNNKFLTKINRICVKCTKENDKESKRSGSAQPSRSRNPKGSKE